MKKILFGIAMIMVLFATATANAAGYFSLKGGLYDPELNYDTAYNLEAAIGIKVNPYFIIDIGGGYQFVEYYTEKVEYYTYKSETKYNYSLVPITLTFKGNYPIQDKVEIFGGGGIGYYFARREFDYTYTDIEYTWSYPYYRNVTKTDSSTSNANAFGYHFVVGSDFNIAQNFALGVEAKWFHVKPKFDYESGGIKVKDLETDLGGWIYNAVLKIRF